MPRYCPGEKCPKHLVRLKSGLFCPVCGTKTVCLPLYPYAVYVESKTFWSAFFLTAGILIFFLCLFYLIIPGINSCNISRAEEEKEISAITQMLPPQWKSLYVSMKECVDGDQYNVLENALSAKNTDYPPLSSDGIGIFMKLINRHNYSRTEDAAALLLSKTEKQEQ